MSIVKKLHCDACGRDESIPLNHVWTVVASADLLKIYRGFAEDVEDAAHICSADCLAKYAARWAADPQALLRASQQASQAPPADRGARSTPAPARAGNGPGEHDS